MIRLRDVQKRYSRGEQSVLACAVDSLEIAAGEQVALIGRSGTGKTTLLHILAGILRPDRGEVEIVGARMDRLGEAARDRHRGRHIGMVYQTFNLLQPFTALENVLMGALFGRGAGGDARLRAEALLQKVGLADRLHHRPSELSVGQVQRVAICRALINDPELVLMDEPLGALDLKLRQEMQGELKRLQQELGVSFVFVTHDQEEALTMSDRIAVMDQGRILQVGSPEEIYEHPANRFVADFIGQTNLLEGTVEDSSTVCLANGARVQASSDRPVGTAVAVSLRPERAHIAATGAVEDRPSVEGVVDRVTYLGNARVYTVRLDWMEVEVREENRPGAALHEPGAPVSIWWDPGAVWVVGDE